MCEPVYKDFPERSHLGMCCIYSFVCVLFCVKLLFNFRQCFNFVYSSEPVGGGDIKAPFWNKHTQICASVLLPMKVNKLPVQRKSVSTCFHISFVC